MVTKANAAMRERDRKHGKKRPWNPLNPFGPMATDAQLKKYAANEEKEDAMAGRKKARKSRARKHCSHCRGPHVRGSHKKKAARKTSRRRSRR